MDVAGTTQSQSGSASTAGILARVMHQHDRQIELALQGAKVGQQPGHFTGMVLVDAMQPDQRIEQQQAGPKPPRRVEQPAAVGFAIKLQRGGRDHMHLNGRQFQTSMAGHARHALTVLPWSVACS